MCSPGGERGEEGSDAKKKAAHSKEKRERGKEGGRLVCVGTRAAWIAEGAERNECHLVKTPAEAGRRIRSLAGPGSGVLIKGSRSERLEQVVAELGQMLSGVNRT